MGKISTLVTAVELHPKVEYNQPMGEVKNTLSYLNFIPFKLAHIEMVIKALFLQ